MSSFRGIDLFGSGPHRFSMGLSGHLLTLNFFEGGFGGGSTAQGLRDQDVVVRGRLVATSESGLWALRDAIRAQLTEPPQRGVLVDTLGRNFTDMALVTYAEATRRDRGRAYSVRYTATFRKLS